MSRRRAILYNSWLSQPDPTRLLVRNQSTSSQSNRRARFIETSEPTPSPSTLPSAQTSPSSTPFSVLSPPLSIPSTSTNDNTSHDYRPPEKRRIAHSKDKTTIAQSDQIVASPTAVPTATISIVTEQWKCWPASPEMIFISNFVTWDLGKIQKNLKTSNPNNDLARYLDVEYWNIEQFNLLKSILWRRLHSKLTAADNPKKFTIKNVQKVEIKGTNERILYCTCESKFTDLKLQSGTAIAIILYVNGQNPKKFLGYITKCEEANEILTFVMIIPVHYLDELSRPAIVKIEGICYVRKMIKNHDMISTALQSSLVQGIIMDPWIDIKSIFNYELGACDLFDGLITLVNGNRGILKGNLIELAVKLIKLINCNNYQANSILVTGLTTDSVHLIEAKLNECGIYGNKAPFDTKVKAHNFIRFDGKQAKVSYTYRRALNSTKVVIAAVHELTELKKYRKNFDVIILNDAAEITEVQSLPALIFSLGSIVLFGDGNHYLNGRSPEDTYELFERNDVFSDGINYLKKYFYQQFSILFYSLGE